MKQGFGNRLSVAVMFFILAMTTSNHSACQTTMGILPVNVAAGGSNVLSGQQWQSLALKFHDYLVMQLAGIGGISKLSREHILLLIKEVPEPDPENLDAATYIMICKKEKLQYLLKCSVESLQVSGKNVLSPLRIIIVDGNTGKVFWEDTVKTKREISDHEISEQILMNEVFKPSVDELSDKIKMLKY